MAKGLSGGKASQAEGTVNARDSAGGHTCAPKRREAGVAGANAHKWVGKADYVGLSKILETLGLYLMREVGAIAEC